jgi:hypothetical protein
VTDKVMVPVEPTEEMMMAGHAALVEEVEKHGTAIGHKDFRRKYASVYKAMLAAAPGDNAGQQGDKAVLHRVQGTTKYGCR